jgi:hypothetical protein
MSLRMANLTTCHMQALIKPTKSDKHPRVMVSMDWTDLLPRSEIVRTMLLFHHCCLCADACSDHAADIPTWLHNPSCCLAFHGAMG